jgi:hypothetical protein
MMPDLMAILWGWAMKKKSLSNARERNGAMYIIFFL